MSNTPNTDATPMTDTLNKIDEMLIKQVTECINLAKKQRQEVIRAYIKRGIYE